VRRAALSAALLCRAAVAWDRLRSDYYGVAGFEKENVKTVYVDVDFKSELMVMAGHMHNPDTNANSGYIVLSHMPSA